MSEFTFGFLIKNTEYNHQLLKELPEVPLMKPLNEDWLVFNYDTEAVSERILGLSERCPILLFNNAEDHGWGFEIYQNRECVSKLEISYEMEETFIWREVEKRFPDIEDPVEFLYFSQEGKEFYSRIKENLKDNKYLFENVKEQFSELNVSAFSLFLLESDKIKQLSEILTPAHVIENMHDLVEQFKEILEMEEMSWIRPDRPEYFSEE